MNVLRCPGSSKCKVDTKIWHKVLSSSTGARDSVHFCRSMVRKVNLRLVTKETKMQSWASPCAIRGGKVRLERGFFPVFRFTPIIVILPMSYSHSIIYHRYYITLAIVVVFKWYLKHTTTCFHSIQNLLKAYEPEILGSILILGSSLRLCLLRCLKTGCFPVLCALSPVHSN